VPIPKPLRIRGSGLHKGTRHFVSLEYSRLYQGDRTGRFVEFRQTEKPWAYQKIRIVQCINVSNKRRRQKT